MKPQVKKIITKLSEDKGINKHQINLSKVDNLQNELESANKSEDAIIRQIISLSNDLIKFENKYKQIAKEANRLQSTLRQGDLEDLGIDYSRVIQNLEAIEDAANFSQAQSQKAQTNIKSVKQYY